MNKDNFFMAMMFGMITLFGTSFEMRSSEKSSLTPYIVGGTVILGVSVLAVRQTASYQTYSNHQTRLAQEKEDSDNSLFHAQPLSRKRSNSETSILSDKAQVYLNNYEQQRRAEAQRYAKKITQETLPSHIIDDYAGEMRK